MEFNATLLSELVAPLAVLAILAMGYGVIRKRLPGTSAAPLALGVMFGGVAVAQMHMPISPMDGLIIDMRNIPVALAGAFLGLRGMIVAFLIASLTRLGIGGVGAISGVGALLLSGGAGLLWDHMTRSGGPRSVRSFVGLAVLMSFHLSAVVLLPMDVALWFLQYAAPWLFAMNLLIIPGLSFLLERERVQILRDGRRRAGVAMRGHQLFVGAHEMALRMAQDAEVPPFQDGADILAVRLKRSSVIAMFWGPEAECHVTMAIHDRLDGVMPDGTLVGLVRDDLLMVCIPKRAGCDVERLKEMVRTELASEPVQVPGMAPIRLRFRLDHVGLDRLPTLNGGLLALGLSPQKGSRFGRDNGGASDVHSPNEGNERLFSVADRLLELNTTDWRA